MSRRFCCWALLGLSFPLFTVTGCSGLVERFPGLTSRAPAPLTAPAEPLPQVTPAATPTAGPQQPLSAPSSHDLWRTIGYELTMAPSAGPEKHTPLALFGNSPGWLAEASENARPFLAYINAEISRRQLPHEIALVPVIESAYNPAATSPAGAAGVWQLMPATARRLGLHQSRWYDGRRDIVASTGAALDYFEALRDRFLGDWKLVFAAYNCGERTVERAIERNARSGRETHFEALDLPQATREYVPRLFALIEIVAHPEAHGVTLADIPDTDHFASIDVGGALDLSRVIAWTSLTADEFDRLNAGFRKRVSVADAPTLVHVPIADAAAVRAGIAALPAAARMQPREHIVASGETLSHIAAASGITVTALKRANRLRSTRLAVGQKILIPTPAAALELTAAPALSKAGEHIVVAGDNLWDLARRYDTTVAALTELNNIGRRATLRIGQRLAIPGAAPAVSAGAARANGHYEVQRGDSLWTISRRFKVSVADLKRWNALKPNAFLRPGQRLVVDNPQSPPGI